MTSPVRGATLIGNGLDVLSGIDAVGDDFFMKTRLLRQGRAESAGRYGAGPRPDAERDGRAARNVRRRRSARTAGRAAEASWPPVPVGRGLRLARRRPRGARLRGRGREPRGGEPSGVGVRVFIGGRTGYAYGTDLSESGLGELGARAAEAAAVAEPDERGAARAGRIEPLPGSAIRPLETRAAASPLALAVERAARAHDPLVERGRGGRLRRLRRTRRDRLLDRLRGEYEASVCFAYCVPRPRARTGRPASPSASAAGPSLDPEAIGARPPQRAVSLHGAPSAESPLPGRARPVRVGKLRVLIGQTLSADAVQRGRSLFAERRASGWPTRAFASSTMAFIRRARHRAFDGEGVPLRRTALIKNGHLQAFLNDTYTAHRGEPLDRSNGSRYGYRAPPSVRPRT